MGYSEVDISTTASTLVGVSGIAGSVSALVIPESVLGVPEVAAVLLISSAALLAGHLWATVIASTSSLLLIGLVWPLALAKFPPDPMALTTVYAAVIGTIPGLFLLKEVVIKTADGFVATASARGKNIALASTSLTSALWLVHPILL